MPLNAGETIKGNLYRYTVIQQIGEGGMSCIYLCNSSAPYGSVDAGRLVVKEMTVAYRNKEDQDNAVKLFLREAELLKELRHKNLPRVVEQFVNGNCYYTVMEFVEGEDLGKMLLRNPHGFAEVKVVQWGIEIATVLYYLHSQKPPIIFRDLKPSNIMISRGQVKLIDFGIARRFDAFKKKDTMRIGSPGYAPPEQYSGQTDRRSDIYALGVTIHQLASGRDPSETQTPFKLPLVRSIKPSVSAGLEAIIVQATELDPQRRFKTALDMKRSLQALIGVQSQPLPPRPSGGTIQIQAPPTPHTPPPQPAPPSAPPRLGPPAIAATPPAEPPRAGNPYSRAGAPSTPHGASTVSPYSGAPSRPAAGPTANASGTASPPSTSGVAGALHAAGPSAAAVSPPVAGSSGAAAAPPTPAGATAPSGTTSPAGSPGATSAVAAGGGAATSPASATASATSKGPRPAGAPLPHQTMSAPAQKASRGPFYFILFVLALFGWKYHAEAITTVRGVMAFFRPTVTAPPTPTPTFSGTPQSTPSAAPLSASGGPSSTPPPQATPTPLTPALRALQLLDDRQIDGALDLLDEARRTQASDPLALLAFNNALVLAEARDDSSPTDTVQVVYVNDAVGNEWLRGVVLAQRDINAGGGVQMHRLLLAPVAVDPRAADGPTLLRAATDRKAIAALIDLPLDRLAAVSAAYAGAKLPLLSRAPRTAAADGASGPSGEGWLKALEAAIPDTRAKSVAIVASPAWPKADLTTLEVDLRKLKTPPATHVFTDDAISEVVAMKPDLVVYLGDSWGLDKFAGRARDAKLTAAILSGPTALGETAGPLADWMKSGRLWVVSPFVPPFSTAGRADDIEGDRIQLEYRRVYGVTAGPGVAAAQGYTLLQGLAAVLDGATTQWTAEGVRTALAPVSSPSPAADRSPSFSGVSVGQGQRPGPWSLLHFDNGAPVVMRIVVP